ncbi:transcriptional regulator, TetR family [Dyella jiangningensis]|uniref:TetR/AcrR family transcriptional regulator n=1 Tax=Dyella sp. AtDHG13 TaxID=1938897 RepID=UPI00088CE713|nr:TetR/AcrR family transcriptional regulator [Dyella sp. AtDHG13]PXV60610.1 TetR family transcriptional regulator [Dyella sp. AtDHG13]SDJ52251.1 transcriptional regulator, TetR family [Dyella jiangningensis]
MSNKHSPAEPAEPAVEGKPKAAERIRRTARELFYREGIRAIGVEEIVTKAGVTKPSLYRSYASKDELAAEYLRDYEVAFWKVFEAGAQTHPDDARAQLMAYIEGLSQRATQAGYRGCGLTNAVVEYPGDDHPARMVAETHKRKLRERLVELSAAMGAREPYMLADGLLLLLEGTYASGQMFGEHGPAESLVAVANQLIDASLR